MEQNFLTLCMYAAPLGWLLTLLERKALVQCMKEKFLLFIARLLVINLPTTIVLIEIIKELT